MLLRFNFDRRKLLFKLLEFHSFVNIIHFKIKSCDLSSIYGFIYLFFLNNLFRFARGFDSMKTRKTLVLSVILPTGLAFVTFFIDSSLVLVTARRYAL